MPTLSSITSFAVNDPLSPSHFNSKLNVLVSNISAINAASSVTANSGLSGTGVANYIPLWSAATSLVTSYMSQVGDRVMVGGPVSITSILVVNSSNTTATSGTVRLSAGGSVQARTMANDANIVMVSHDSVNNRVNIGTPASGTGSVAIYVNHDFKWITDGTYTIGAETGDRPRRVYFTDYVVVGNNVPQGNGAFRANYRDDILVGRNDSNNSDIVMWGVTSSNEIRQGTTLNSRDMIVKAPILQDYAEKLHAFGTISANTVASLTSGPMFTATATSNVSFQMAGAPASPNAGTASFLLTASGSTITFSFLSTSFGAQGNPAGVVNGTKMLVNLLTVDGGLTYIGSYVTGFT